MELTKRDYFAAQALSGLLAREAHGVGPGTVYDRAAIEAYNYADAMLKLSRTLHDPVEIDPDDLSRRQGQTLEGIHIVPQG